MIKYEIYFAKTVRRKKEKEFHFTMVSLKLNTQITYTKSGIEHVQLSIEMYFSLLGNYCNKLLHAKIKKTLTITTALTFIKGFSCTRYLFFV